MANNVVCMHYDSVDAVIRAADQAHKAGRIHRGSDRESICRSDFVGRTFRNWEDCQKQAEAVWPEGLDIVRSMVDDLEHVSLPTPKSRRRKARWDDYDGDEIDPDRLRGGSSPWRKMYREFTAGPQTVVIVSAIGAFARENPRNILWRGVASLILADILERNGYRVEVCIAEKVTKAYTNGASRLVTIRLKEASHPVDIASMVNAVSGWFFRSVFFQSLYNHADYRRLEDHLGRPESVHNEPLLTEYLGAGTTAQVIYVENIFSRQEAIERIQSAIQEIQEGGKQ